MRNTSKLQSISGIKKSIIATLLVTLIVPVAMAYIPPKRVHPEVSYNTFKLHHTMLPQVGELATKPSDGKIANTPEIVAELLIRTGEVIREENPKAEILAFGLCKNYMCDYIAKVLEILKKRKKLDVLDRVSYHVYFENPDNATERIKAMRATENSAATALPTRITRLSAQ